jgi:hypothetical protein
MTRRRSMRGGLADVRWLSVYTIYKYTYIWLKCWLPWPGSTWWKSVALVRNHFAASSLGARGFNWWAHTTWCQQSPLLGFLSVLCAFPGGEMNKRDCRRFSPPGHYFYERVFFYFRFFFQLESWWLRKMWVSQVDVDFLVSFYDSACSTLLISFKQHRQTAQQLWKWKY